MILLVGDTFLVVEALPVGCLVIFMVTFGMGPGTIPWSLQGELVSAEVKQGHSSHTVFDI